MGAIVHASRVASVLSLAIASLGPIACGSSSATPPPAADSGGPIAASMNDVSILFPFPSSVADIASLLPASASGARGPLFPSALYASVGPIAGSTSLANDAGSPSFVAAYSDLYLVALRIDPCFASLAPDPHGVGCTAQIRLVFQEITYQGGVTGVRAFDSALHVFYSLTRDEFLALARALVALRVANANGATLGPLAPHPIMVSQGLSGAMSKGVEALVLQYAGAENTTHVAQLGVIRNELGGDWSFSAFDVADGGTSATPFAIPTLEEDGGSVSLQTVGTNLPNPELDAGPGNVFTVEFTPTTTSADDLAPLDDGTPFSLSAPARQAAFDGLVRVENPADDSAATIDCGSCHFAALTEDLLAMPDFSLVDTASSLAFVPDGKSVVAPDMATTFGTDLSTGEVNVHGFSYVLRFPNITRRVVNETASIVQYLNDLPY